MNRPTKEQLDALPHWAGDYVNALEDHLRAEKRENANLRAREEELAAENGRLREALQAQRAWHSQYDDKLNARRAEHAEQIAQIDAALRADMGEPLCALCEGSGVHEWEEPGTLAGGEMPCPQCRPALRGKGEANARR
jgi:multidrug efflux pump subunit AcrA (membrane-fusion protein)